MTEAALRAQLKLELTSEEATQLSVLAAESGVSRQQIIRRLIEAEYKRWLRARR